MAPETEWEMMLFKNEELVNYLNALEVTKSIYKYMPYVRDGSPSSLRMMSKVRFKM